MAIFTAIGTAVLGGSAAVAAAGTSAAAVAATGAAVVSGVGAAGQGVMARKASIAQERIARVQNSRERVKQLAAMRQKQRANEFIGVVSGTGGSSSQAAQRGSIASQAASNIGQSFQQQSAAQKLSSINNMQTGFGVLQKVGEIGMAMPGKQKNEMFPTPPSA
jgi:hypothetical protein